MAIFPPIWRPSSALRDKSTPSENTYGARPFGDYYGINSPNLGLDKYSQMIPSGIRIAPETAPGGIKSAQDRMAHLEMRLRMPSSALREKLPGLGTTYEEGMIYVHFVRAGALQVFTDEPGMFPSDALVNNLRLCL